MHVKQHLSVEETQLGSVIVLHLVSIVSFFLKMFFFLKKKETQTHSNNSDPDQALLLSGTIWPLTTRGLLPHISKAGRVVPNIRQTVLGMIKKMKSACNVSGIFFNDKNIAQHFLG